MLPQDGRLRPPPRPALVLVHAVPETGSHWRHLVPKLTPRHTPELSRLLVPNG
ncbi:hypothetical protein [Streptomyces sp. NPDC002491]